MDAISRREFIKLTSSLSTLMLPIHLDAQANTSSELKSEMIGPFVAISNDGLVHISATWAEMGTGAKTALPMLIAEELDADPQSIRYVDVAHTDYKKFGSQGGGASSAIRGNWNKYREAGAKVRSVLIQAAAKSWGIEPQYCQTANGEVVNQFNDARLSYAQLVPIAKTISFPEEVSLKSADNFNVLGNSQSQIGLKDIITGKAEFGIDAAKPNMLYCCLARSPWKDGKLLAFDKEQASHQNGVIKTVAVEGEKADWGTFVHPSVGVICHSSWQALLAKNTLNPEWQKPKVLHEEPDLTSFRKLAANAPLIKRRGVPSQDTTEGHHFKAEYVNQASAHAQMEPLNCIACWHDEEHLSVVGPFQSPTAVIHLIARRFKLDMANVEVETTRIGGSFGRKQAMDFVWEAALVAKQVPGRWVKVLWSREDDFLCAGVRCSFYHQMQAQVAADGSLKHWAHRVVRGSGNDGQPDNEQNSGSYQGQSNFPYETEYAEFHAGFYPVLVNEASFRGVYYPCNLYAVNCFLDEIARELGIDSVAYHRQLLGNQKLLDYRTNYFPVEDVEAKQNRHLVYDVQRQLNVINKVTEACKWEERKGTGWGFACGLCFSSYVAVIVKMSGSEEQKVEEVWTAIDCGQIVNADGIQSQLEGGVVWGITQAFKQNLSFDNGQVLPSNFDQFHLARMTDSPKVNTLLVESELSPTGVGEPVVACIAPAIVNAIADRDGTYQRQLPTSSNYFTVAL